MPIKSPCLVYFPVKGTARETSPSYLSSHYPTQPGLDQGFPHPSPAGSTKDSSCSLRLKARERPGPPSSAQRGCAGEQCVCLWGVSGSDSCCISDPCVLLLVSSHLALSFISVSVFLYLCLSLLYLSFSCSFSMSVSLCLSSSLCVTLFLAPTLCG